MLSRALCARTAATALIKRNHLRQCISPHRSFSVEAHQATSTSFAPHIHLSTTTTFPRVFNEIRTADVLTDVPHVKPFTVGNFPHLPVSVHQTWNECGTGLEIAIQPPQSYVHEQVIQASSTLKKRRLKMNRHKYRKRRKRDRRKSK